MHDPELEYQHGKPHMVCAFGDKGQTGITIHRYFPDNSRTKVSLSTVVISWYISISINAKVLGAVSLRSEGLMKREVLIAMLLLTA